MIDPGNVGDGLGEYRNSDQLEEFRLLDSLPMPIRRALQDAPYDYSVKDITDAYNKSRNDFNWDTMTYMKVDPVSFTRQMVGNFQMDVTQFSMTKTECMGRYWFKKHSGLKLTQRRSRAILRRAYPHMLPTPRSLT